LAKNKEWVQQCDIMKHNETTQVTGKNQLSKPLKPLLSSFLSQTALGAQAADLTVAIKRLPVAPAPSSVSLSQNSRLSSISDL